ncbi:MAG: aminomethyl-transferring glycine dehydrogenase subunit GcvPA [Proteobacteria bacterium]|nr:aminomethyl-transferring glycine dehydrogenase subunit GcvPA [Pseudomonadota bacterium]MBI3496403.1 aminomethyl-transferring glycine dehydrogenase subunit GcvPA [Pseudomonadota bacterium]
MRYLPLTPNDRRQMLAAIGVPSVDTLFKDVPEQARLKGPVDLPAHLGEIEVERLLSAIAAKNLAAGSCPSFIGAGAYRHHVPAAVDHLIQRGEFLTSYTPYQPEVAQGTLQYLFEFQTQVALITGMEVANASMYDGSTATAEAVLMANRITRRRRAVLSGGLHPMYRQVVATHAKFAGFKAELLAPDPHGTEDIVNSLGDDVSAVVVQYPSVFGRIGDLTPIAEAAHAKGALLIVVVTEIVALGALESPGAMGADIVVGEGQSIGNGLTFGGPYVGLFASREKYVRQMPGRLVGQTHDVDGRRGWVLTLSTREQHIRREKATSNICTNSGLCALAFTIHMALLGDAGFTRLAALNHAAAMRLADKLGRVPGVSVLNPAFFNEFTVKLAKPAARVVERLAKKRILAGVPVSRFYPRQKDLADLLIVAATETTTESDMEALSGAFAEAVR